MAWGPGAGKFFAGGCYCARAQNKRDIRKGITTEAEIMEEVKRIKQEQGIVVG
jgi:hypothetical protein